MTSISSSVSAVTSAMSQSLLASAMGVNIDVNSLITALVQADGDAVYTQIDAQQTNINTELSGLGSLNSALSTFQSALKGLQTGSVFQADTATSSNSSVLTVTAGTGAATANHQIEVDQLATAQNSMSTAEFASSSATVGTGTLTFTSGSGSTFNVAVNSGNDTLAQVVSAINSASGNNFVTASIINVDSASGSGLVSKLVLTGNSTGTVNSFTVTGSDNDGNNTDNSGLSQLFSTNLSNYTTATNAQIKVDGQTATVASNSISDVLQGITLNLQSAAVGTTVNVGVSLNTSAISSAVSNFVTAYNNLQKTTQSLGSFGGSTSSNGPLIGNAMLEYVTSQIRQTSSAVVPSASGVYDSLAMIGVTVNQDGVMSLDGSVLTDALAANTASVSNVFSSSSGVAVQLNDLLTNILQTGSPLKDQIASLNDQLSSLTTQANNETARLDTYKASLQLEFGSMESIVAQYNDTGTFLTSWIKSGG